VRNPFHCEGSLAGGSFRSLISTIGGPARKALDTGGDQPSRGNNLGHRDGGYLELFYEKKQGRVDEKKKNYGGEATLPGVNIPSRVTSR